MSDNELNTDDPRFSADALISPSVRQRLESANRAGALVGGWLLAGPRQIGKATLAYAIAQWVIGQTDHLGATNPQVAPLIHNGSHPDLFVVERQAHEKTGRMRSEIVVDDIRGVINGLHRTSTTGHRVVIVDTADDLNRQAANALLKMLEEPPQGTLLLLLSSAPGRLLPTIKSRCRKLSLAPLKDEELLPFLEKNRGLRGQEAADIVRLAGGRPGRALDLASGEGAEARKLVQGFWSALSPRGDLIAAATAMASKTADELWPEVRQLILDDIGDAIVCRGRGETPLRTELAEADVPALLDLHENLTALTRRADALNSDRTQTALMMGLKTREAARGSHAGR
ncbi:AAA family ATPase [Parvularcula sp. LCG005]|uniref:AAA family ATPase n=1 Tax=Parvularcula sp. LCG005 TaxID=3078805 RepID=UPI00294246EC|nr:AAA family ATPase [Parvularcula sp. LCG005]WOI54796.1 AAA family ATPase [Parvularcula sp. LCG005]